MRNVSPATLVDTNVLVYANAFDSAPRPLGPIRRPLKLALD